MGTSLSFLWEGQTLKADGNHVPDDCIEKVLEAAAGGSISFKGRHLEGTPSGSISFKGSTLERNASGSISFKGTNGQTTPLRTLSFKGTSREATPLRSISFKGIDLATTTIGEISFKGTELEADSMRVNSSKERAFDGSSVGSGSFKEEAAAVKLQKVYKSYRTRRNLADCAVLVEELWWQAIDFVTLKRSTVSFFDKPETAISRWSRARIKAAKVGKGLSKDDKARKLAFQHWLEAIDPRHRYGHNLHFYYDSWFESDTVQPFFYWLDVGDGRDLSLDSCQRGKLQQQCIKYLGPKEREHYEVIVEDGKLVYKQSGQPVDTLKGSKGCKWIFVLSTSKMLYVGQKTKGTFQHSSFLAGGATSAAGRLVVEEGVLKSIWPYSGHYLPTEENFNEFINFLEENRVNLTDVQRTSADEDEQSIQLGKTIITGSEQNLEAKKDAQHLGENLGKIDSNKECTGNNDILKVVEASTDLCPNVEMNETGGQVGSRLTSHEQTYDNDSEKTYDNDSDIHVPVIEGSMVGRTGNGVQEAHKTADLQDDTEHVSYKRSLSDKNLENDGTEVPPQSLLQRLNSIKSMQSYQLGKQLSIKWSTGAGPRILCVRDYPSELRAMALEKVNLSPRCGSSSSPKVFYGPSGSPKVFSGSGPSSSPKAFPGSSGSPRVFSAQSRHPMSPATVS
eukprot:PITA_14769